jgi:hypothetical protein
VPEVWNREKGGELTAQEALVKTLGVDAPRPLNSLDLEREVMKHEHFSEKIF